MNAEKTLAAAFASQRARLARVLLVRLVVEGAVVFGALHLRHWAMWTVFGIVTFFQVATLIGLVIALRMSERFRAKVANNPSLVVRIHTAPEPRTKLQRLELHDAAGDTAYLFVTPAMADEVLVAMAALPSAPTVTTGAST